MTHSIDQIMGDLLSEIHQLKAENQRLRGVNDNRKCLTDREVRRIREHYRNGKSQADLADMFDVNPATVSRIVREQYWKGVK